MMRPAPSVGMCGSAACDDMERAHHVDVECEPKRLVGQLGNIAGEVTPALLTTMCRLPSVSAAAWAAAALCRRRGR